MRCGNQPVNKRQMEEEAPADKRQRRITRQRRRLIARRRRRIKKTRARGDSGRTTGVTQQPAGKQEANRRGGVSRQDERGRRRDARRQDNQPANERHPGWEAPADKMRQHLELKAGNASR